MTSTDTATSETQPDSRYAGALFKALTVVGLLGSVVLAALTYLGNMAILEGVIAAFIALIVGIVSLVISVYVYS